MLAKLRSHALRRFVLLYAAMCAGFGVASPFLPAFLESRALTAQESGATALLTLASGFLYGWLGAHGFWIMAALCVAALPLATGLTRR
jgi:PPP family 3-phenylpropionic acid transporter